VLHTPTGPGWQGATGRHTLVQLERYEEALAAYDRSLELDPDDATAHNARGRVLWDLERYEDAYGAFDRSRRTGS
jgi:tetratricopeptide (TPR) repeat protein